MSPNPGSRNAALVALLLLVGMAAPTAQPSGGAEAARPGKITFDLDIPLISGGYLAAEEMRGKILVVDVWGTWCGPCRRVIPELVDIQDRFGPRGVKVIGISAERTGSVEEAARKVLRYAAEVGINYSLGIFDPELYRWIHSLMNFEGDSFTVPSTFVVDVDGAVIARYPGYFPGQEREIARVLAEALRRRPAPANALAAGAGETGEEPAP